MSTLVDLARREVCTENGQTLGYADLISTIPLDQLVELAGLDAMKDGLFAATEILNVRVGVRGVARLASTGSTCPTPGAVPQDQLSRERQSERPVPPGARASRSSTRLPQSVPASPAMEITSAALEYVSRHGLMEIEDVLVTDEYEISPAYVVERAPGRPELAELARAVSPREGRTARGSVRHLGLHVHRGRLCLGKARGNRTAAADSPVTVLPPRTAGNSGSPVGSALVFPVAAVGAALATIGARALARRAGVVATPGSIVQQHTQAVPLLGGLGIAAGIALWAVVSRAEGVSLPLLVGSATFLALGLVDDLRPLTAGRKLIAQIVAASAPVALGLTIPLSGNAGLDHALALLWVVVVVNAVNVTDVCDGLAVGLALVSFLGLTSFAEPALTPLCIAAAGACLGVLVFNSPPASIFLGEAGTALLGFLLAGVAIASMQAGSWRDLASAALAVGVFLFEAVFLVAVRARRGVAWWRGSADHFSLRLQAAGLSRWQTDAVAWVAGLGLALAAYAVQWAAPARSGRSPRSRAGLRRRGLAPAHPLGSGDAVVLANVRVLLVTMYYPPTGGGSVQRPLAFATHLPELGFETFVLTPDDSKWTERDESLAQPPSARVVRVRNLGPAHAASRVRAPWTPRRTTTGSTCARRGSQSARARRQRRVECRRRGHGGAAGATRAHRRRADDVAASCPSTSSARLRSV